MARTKRTFRIIEPSTAQPSHQELPNPPSSQVTEPSPSPPQPSRKRFKTTSKRPAYIKELVLPAFYFTNRIATLPSPIHRAISMGEIERPPRHGRDYVWDEWLKTTTHLPTMSQKPPTREDTPPPSRSKKTCRNKAEEFQEKIREHNRKKLQNSWESIQVIKGIMKFNNPYKQGMVVIPLSLHRHQSILNFEPRDQMDGEKLAFTKSWSSRELKILEGILLPKKPRQQIGDIH
ncbi:uncharacterized protein LOC131234307 [Magnolia sinica]|uniref:uncharacterized protein LOC131234307 n=1 Tax=Magnolia sinica TaxID=86752 RepID=UPI0026581FC4|nr:uncharacterized protein LOC131234307 [Magnolia sinica]